MQLRSPFAPPKPELSLLDNETLGPPELVWVDNAVIARRAAKVTSVLEFLQTFQPHVIAFPEYAVPAQCHDHAMFQEYADKYSCVIVPGSYYERDRQNPRHRNNVVRIYIPGQEPLDIVKHDRFNLEEKALTPTPGTPNIAHLTWQTGAGPAISMSIFICRDYLVPYDVAHRSLLDWEHPGLNLIVMLSAQTSLFEAQAGLDVRRLRGKGRFVALCNCAATNEEESMFTGTALLGPTKDSRRKQGDLIERLPSDREGILTAELDLQEVAFIETKPAKTEHDPLGSVRRYYILQEDADHHVLFDPIGDPSPTERGVWHPALLEVLGRNITILLRKSRRYREVATTLRDPSNNKIRFVSAAGLLGDQDFLFRLYEDAAEKLNLAGTPYSSLPAAEQNRLFEQESQKYIIEPKSIYKYRTNAVPNDPQQWEAKKKEMNDLLPRRANRKKRRTLLSALCRLARNWNDTEVPDDLAKRVQTFFLNKTERVPRLGPNSGNSLRRRYILVGLSNGAGPHEIDVFERHIIRQWLLNLPEVRSLYRLFTKSASTQFHFWIDVIADPYEADALLLELQRRCEDEKLEIGTRSIDVMEHLLHESIEGIENTDFGEETCRFMQEVGGVELDTAVMLENHEFIFDWARAWDSQTAAIDPTVAPTASDKITKFYRCFFACNFAVHEAIRIEFLREAANAWMMIYQDLETACQQFLMRSCGTTDKEELDRVITAHFTEKKANQVAEIRSDWIRLLLEYMHACIPERSLPDIDDMKGMRRLFADVLRKFRNDMGHEADPRKKDALYVLGMPLGERQNNAQKVTEATRGLVELLNAVLTAQQAERL